MNFAEHIRALAPKLKSSAGEALADLEYGDELALKNKALANFWNTFKLTGSPEPIVASPLARGYRTTSKRRGDLQYGRLTFDFSELASHGGCAESVLEPEAHNAIYRLLHEKISTPAFVALARALNWIIIRGSYKQRMVIFNVYRLDATVVRKLKQIATVLQQAPLQVVAVHMYYDPTRSEYYLEALRPVDGMQFKQMYGPNKLALDRDGYRLFYPVTGFSQVNESMVGPMVDRARNLLAPGREHRLLDLYCGYGLFSFGLGRETRACLGVEWEGPSIASAKESAKFLKLGNMQFMAGRIDAVFAGSRLPPVQGPELMLLDPPRKGTEPGVLRTLAQRAPERVLHVFCGTDEIPRELAEWKSVGYTPTRIAPLDMFPGTPSLETLVLLEPNSPYKVRRP